MERWIWAGGELKIIISTEKLNYIHLHKFNCSTSTSPQKGNSTCQVYPICECHKYKMRRVKTVPLGSVWFSCVSHEVRILIYLTVHNVVLQLYVFSTRGHLNTSQLFWCSTKTNWRNHYSFPLEKKQLCWSQWATVLNC
jgi:hypothetical protein